MYLTWLRRFFRIDESRLRVKLYLHEGLNLEAAVDFWSQLTAIPFDLFTKPCPRRRRSDEATHQNTS